MTYLDDLHQYLCSGADVLTRGEKHFQELRRQLYAGKLEKGSLLVYHNDIKDRRLIFQILTDIDLEITTNRSLVYYVEGSVVDSRSGKVIDRHIPVFRFSMMRLPTRMEFNQYNAIDTV